MNSFKSFVALGLSLCLQEKVWLITLGLVTVYRDVSGSLSLCKLAEKSLNIFVKISRATSKVELNKLLNQVL